MPYIICILALISFMGCDDKKKEVEQKKISQEQIEKIKVKAIEKMKEIVTHGYAPIIYKKYIKNDLLFPNLGSIRNRVYGKKKAPIGLVVFSDFACGHCKHATKELKLRVDENKDLVNLTYVLFPLDKACNANLAGKFSDYSCISAKLALCAEKQGKFWKSIDFLYANKPNPSKANPLDIKLLTKKMEKELKLLGMENCIKSKWLKKRILEENKIYKGIKIPGTPYVLLNNRAIGKIYKKKDVFYNFIKYVNLKENPN